MSSRSQPELSCTMSNDNDLLDLLGVGPAAKAKFSDVGFDPDAGTANAVVEIGLKSPIIEDRSAGIEDMFDTGAQARSAHAPVPSSSASGGSAAPTTTGPTTTDPLNGVDPDELRRRIRGEGSEKPSSLQRIRTAASDAAGGAVSRIRGRVSDTARWKVVVGVLLMLLLFIGIQHTMQRASRDISADDFVIVTEASKLPAKPKIRNPSNKKEASSKDSLVDEELAHTAKVSKTSSDDDSPSPEEDADSEDPPPSRSRGAAGSASSSKEFLSLQRAVLDSKEQILREVAALRKEVSRLRAAQSGSSKEDPSSTASGSRSRSSARDRDVGYGEVYAEPPQRKSFASQPSPSTAGTRRRARAPVADEEDNSAGSVSEAQKWAAGEDVSDSPSSDTGGVGGVREVVSR